MNKTKKNEIDLDYLGLKNNRKIYWNLQNPQCIEKAISNGEAQLSSTGALLVKTGEFTGRSPNDKFIVDHAGETDKEIDWGKINRPFDPEKFCKLFQKVIDHLQNKEIYIQDVYLGSHPQHQRKIRVITEYAWSSLFTNNLFIPAGSIFSFLPDFTIIQAPSCFAEPEVDGTNSKTFILIDFEKKIALIGYTEYAGEIKKTAFTIMNRLLPSEGVLPMHCSANIGSDNKTALFFGLSGTGKTTLSSDPNRFLIGDDEHGWSNDGVFNFEGGCYAKTINLKKDLEPIIWNASQRFGAVLENVVYDEETREIDFSDGRITENTRVAYPLRFIEKRIKDGRGGHPTNIFFLCADAFGVLPPISKLTPDQVVYFFLSGYTAKLAGTERNLGVEPKATFSTCFGAPFMPLNPVHYANLLKQKITEFNSKVWLVNTGWTGGPYGIGSRIKLPYTRAMISAAINGVLDTVHFKKESIFGLYIPEFIPEVPKELLDPSKNSDDKEPYLKISSELIQKFRDNISQYKGSVNEEILRQL